MSLFQDLKTDGFEENQDRVGGFSPLDSDVYAGTIKVAYAGQSAGGAKNVTLLIDFAGREYRETIYITNKKGENFFLNKEDKTKKVALPGFTTIDDICQVCTDRPLFEQPTEEKVVKVYDPEQRQEVPKAVPVLTELLGKPVLLAIKKTLVNKTEGQGDQRVPIADTREENSIEKVFHPTLRITVVEAKNGIAEPTFINTWLERNKGKTQDKRQIKDGEGGRSGRPGQSSGPPQAGQATGQRKSLFGGNSAAA